MLRNEVDLGLGGGSLLQVANRSHVQMMSYVIETSEGKTLVIDGGYYCQEDAENLCALIKERGSRVDMWIITHGHDDHFGALLWILKHTNRLEFEIGSLYADFPPVEWFSTVENSHYYPIVCDFMQQLSRHGIALEPFPCGGLISCGSMVIEVIKTANYEKYTNINDSSVVFRMRFPQRDVLFLADLGVSGGADLPVTCQPKKLHCDIVQMAHHGQCGVSRTFYEAVAPKVCLYPTPDWLWENDNGGGKGSGPWATLETRRWMDELGVEQSYPYACGDYLFR